MTGPRKKKPSVTPLPSRLVELIRGGAERVRLPEWPAGRHIRLKWPGPEATIFEGDRRLNIYWLGADDWNNPSWEVIP